MDIVSYEIGDKARQSVDSHKLNNANPHGVTKAQVGLDQVDNTNDVNKPVSTAQDTRFTAVETTANAAAPQVTTYTKAEDDALLATKLPSSSYTANDVLAKVKTVDGPLSGLDADTVDGVQGALLGIGGAGYTVVDETVNRVLGTAYTNTNGKAIEVIISLISASSAESWGSLYVNGHRVDSRVPRLSGSRVYSLYSVIVPAYHDIRIVDNAWGSLYKWLEIK